MIRRLTAALVILGCATVPDVATPLPGNGVVTTPDHGCSLFTTIPNPCDPDSWN